MTIEKRAGNVKFMRRLIFALLVPGIGASGQNVPGRDLLDFPVGTLAEAAPLARLAGDGLWNPAAIVLPERARLRISAVALSTPADQGVSAQLLAAAARMPWNHTLALSVLRAGVNDIWRTESDPQTIGNEVPYHTTMVSASLAQRRNGLSLGIAARYRFGQMDGTRRAAFLLDGGVMAYGLLGFDINAGASSFLWRPGDSGSERTLLSAAADAGIVGSDTLRQARLGYSFSFAARETEHYGYASARYRHWQGNVGVARHEKYDVDDWRLRLGVGLRYARYVIGIAREENGAGLPPIYQFALSATVN